MKIPTIRRIINGVGVSKYLDGFVLDSIMAFSRKELAQIERVVGDFCRDGVPVQFKDQVRISYSIKNHDVLISESRPGWRNPSEWVESPIAKLRFVRTANKWRLYWLRASGKWMLYGPYSRSKTLRSMVREIELDSYGCFFG